MPQKAAQAIQIQSIFQLLVCEGMAASVRRDADIGIDAHRVGGFLHEHADCLIVEAFSVFAEENIFILTVPCHEILLSCSQVLVQELPDSRILWHNAFFSSFSIDHKIGILYLVQLHVRQFAQSDPRIKENHENHFVAYTDIVAAIEVFDHAQDLFAVEGVDQNLRLLYIPYPLGKDLFTIPFPLSISTHTLDRFQQIVDICGLTLSFLKRTDILLHMIRLQVFKQNDFKVFPNKMAELVELFFVIMDCKIREFSDLAIEQKLMNQFG